MSSPPPRGGNIPRKITPPNVSIRFYRRLLGVPQVCQVLVITTMWMWFNQYHYQEEVEVGCNFHFTVHVCKLQEWLALCLLPAFPLLRPLSNVWYRHTNCEPSHMVGQCSLDCIDAEGMARTCVFCVHVLIPIKINFCILFLETCCCWCCERSHSVGLCLAE